jgi:quercetin dioxygenase-like cupin family protein
MKRMRARLAMVCAAVALVATAGIAILKAQPAPKVSRTVLLKQDSTVPGREVVMAAVEIPPGGTEGKHTHPAEVYAYVREGELQLFVEGQPIKTLKAGDVFAIAPGQVHEGSNKGPATVKLTAVFFAEKGKPLTTPVQ